MSETPRQEWKAQLATRAGAYHRVERVGTHPTEEPVALVKEARHAQAIAMLPRIAASLHDVVTEINEAPNAPEGLRSLAGARLVLADLAKVKAPL